MFGTQGRHRLAAGGSPIVWKGEYEGKAYEDKGEVLEVVPERTAQGDPLQPLERRGRRPEKYHTLTSSSRSENGMTHVSLSQDNNSSQEAAEHSRENWEKMLSGLKATVEASELVSSRSTSSAHSAWTRNGSRPSRCTSRR